MIMCALNMNKNSIFFSHVSAFGEKFSHNKRLCMRKKHHHIQTNNIPVFFREYDSIVRRPRLSGALRARFLYLLFNA